MFIREESLEVPLRGERGFLSSESWEPSGFFHIREVYICCYSHYIAISCLCRQTQKNKVTTHTVIISYSLGGALHFIHHLYNEARMDEVIAFALSIPFTYALFIHFKCISSE